MNIRDYAGDKLRRVKADLKVYATKTAVCIILEFRIQEYVSKDPLLEKFYQTLNECKEIYERIRKNTGVKTSRKENAKRA